MLFPAEEAGSDRDVDLDVAYALPTPTPTPGAIHVRASFVSSIDGAAEIDGRSGPLGGSADQRILRTLRSMSDVILVGAGTVRAEGYGGIRLPADRRESRMASGRTPVPPLAVVSGRLDLDPNLPLFSGAEVPPLILTTETAPADRRKAVEAVAELVVLGDKTVNFADALASLASRGLNRVLCEGGPSVFAALAAAGLVDELCITVSPLLAGPSRSRIIAGKPWTAGRKLDLRHVLEDDGSLFLRYTSRTDAATPIPG
jgi:riboflavin biosynthesis pyrimidine reductase